jgi:serine protease Do
MKKQIILTTTLAALLPLAALAQSPTAAATSQPAQQPIPPMPLAPAPPAPGPGRHIHEHDMGPKEPVTFLGVETSNVPRVLSEQMNLPRGFGVVIDYVVPNSPAAAAGVQRSDIIRMLNDQIIVEPDQLGKLVRSFADGTNVTLTLLRKGQEVKVNVKLAKKETPAGRGPLGFEREWKWDDLGRMEFDMPDMATVREAVARAREQALRAGDEARRAVQRLRVVTTDGGTTRSTKVDLGKATITFSDEKGELKMESVDGKKMLTAKDAQGNVLFSGPIDTEEQRTKLPAEVRKRFEKLENQELPEIPEAPEPPEPPEAPDGNESVHLQNPGIERAALSAGNRSGWRRSTMLL